MTTLSPRAIPAARAKSGSSSTSAGTSSGPILVAVSSAGLDLEVADGLAPGRAPVEDRDPRAHALQHVQEARAGRVEADPVQPQLRARRGAWPRGRTAPRRRRRPGRSSRERRQALGRPDGGLPRRPADARRPSPRASARCDRGSDGGSTAVVLPLLGVQPGEQDARLHLRARDRELAADGPQLAALDGERRVAVGRLDPSRPSPAAARRSAPSAARSATRRRPARNGPAARPGCPGRRRMSVPALPQSRGSAGARSPRMPDPLDADALALDLHPGPERAQTPRPWTACPSRPRSPRSRSSPSATAASSSARCEIDLSPRHREVARAATTAGSIRTRYSSSKAGETITE